jgi:hypothetical protein
LEFSQIKGVLRQCEEERESEDERVDEGLREAGERRYLRSKEVLKASRRKWNTAGEDPKPTILIFNRVSNTCQSASVQICKILSSLGVIVTTVSAQNMKERAAVWVREGVVCSSLFAFPSEVVVEIFKRSFLLDSSRRFKIPSSLAELFLRVRLP